MIRVYGMTIGKGSYARVTHGVTDVLKSLGLLAGVVPLDMLDEWGEYDGALADVGVFIGPQAGPLVMSTMGVARHDRRMMLLPLNSSHCPKSMLDFALKPAGQPIVSEWLTPSQWSKQRLAPLTSAPVSVWPHGVSEDYSPSSVAHEGLVNAYKHDKFRLLHLTSTVRQRKGTTQLIQGWTKAMQSGRLPKDARLAVIVGGGDAAAIRMLAERAGDSIGVLDDNDPRIGDVDSEFLRRYHGVVQPSRGEGFGMVPLEALCSGVPAIATVCSGHSQYMDADTPGVVAVKHGPDARIDDGPDAVAPSVSADAVAEALARGYETWPQVALAAQENAGVMRAKWSWSEVVSNWARNEGWLR